MFYDFLERKNAFLGYKNKKFKKSKNCHFSKGVNPWFLSKKWPFLKVLFFLCNIGQENVFYDILQRKNPFLGYKNNKFQKKEVQKVEKLTFFLKGLTHSFGLKLAIFKRFFYRQYRLGKFLLRYSRTKKPLFRL